MKNIIEVMIKKMNQAISKPAQLCDQVSGREKPGKKGRYRILIECWESGISFLVVVSLYILSSTI
jgi:hypothetical protein